jgi:hypothetical protein
MLKAQVLKAQVLKAQILEMQVSVFGRSRPLTVQRSAVWANTPHIARSTPLRSTPLCEGICHVRGG